MEGINEIAGALAKAQSAITSPPRNREVTVKTKTGGSYKFKYATLDAIIDHVRGPLTANGIWFTQTLANGDGKYRLVTTLMHSSGQTIVSETPLLVDSADNQAFGSALTYMKRYALAALLGVAADEDDDANSADGNTVTESKDRTAATIKRGDKAAPAVSPGIGPIPVGLKNDEPDWTAWCGQFTAALAQCKDVLDVNRLWTSNEGPLANLKKASSKWHLALEDRSNHRRGDLSQQPAA